MAIADDDAPTLDVLADLETRNLVVQVSDRAGLAEHLSGAVRTLYCGFDPTADSLHLGHLVQLLTLRRFQLAGHRPIVLVGGATGLIGDPSFRDDERGLNETDTVAGWVRRIEAQVQPFVDFDGPNGAIMANNLDWTRDLDVITFLRDIGKHFSVNAMIQRDSVRARLEREDQGISYTEFSYMLLQSLDFLELARRHECSLQIGGTDQWGNIVSGVDLVRRVLKRNAYALTTPLITKADGTKFGKTAGGAVWLDPNKTSPYSFYQFWLNAADADVVQFLRAFTFLTPDDIEDLARAVNRAPAQREAQTMLARSVTRLVHGPAAVTSAERIARALFGGDIAALTEADLEQLRQDGMGVTELSEAVVPLAQALADAGLVRSRGAARKLVASGGVNVNGRNEEDAERTLDFSDALHGRYYLLRRGKKTWHLVVRA